MLETKWNNCFCQYQSAILSRFLAIVGVGCRFSIAFIHSSFLLYGVIRYSIIHSLYSFLYENGSIENNKSYTCISRSDVIKYKHVSIGAMLSKRCSSIVCYRRLPFCDDNTDSNGNWQSIESIEISLHYLI